jgi:acetyl-CoA carboxylase biotin carboxyl carrier protein
LGSKDKGAGGLLEGGHDWLRSIAQIMTQNDLSEVLIEEKGHKVRLRRGAAVTAATPIVTPIAGPMAAGGAQSPAAAAALAGGGGAGEAPPEDGVIEVQSPMVGTFYRSPSPESDPFVDTGDAVKEESVLCIIEAMKVMNEIKAEVAGTIEDVLVANGEAVEFGQPLFRIRTSG